MINVITIHIFPHIGSKIPEIALPYIDSKITQKEITDTIETNRDTGLDDIIKIFKKRKNEVTLEFQYSRALCDVNRTDPDNIVPEKLYRGNDLLTNEDKNKIKKGIIEEYAIPWQMKVIALCQKHPDAKVVHWHSYDVYNQGISVLLDKPKNKTIRPFGQIITRADSRFSSLKPYFPKIHEEIFECKLIDKKYHSEILHIFTKYLAKYASEKKPKIELDSPYKLFGTRNGKRIFGSSLPNLVGIATDNKPNHQLCFEIRKDILQADGASEALIMTVDDVVTLLQ